MHMRQRGTGQSLVEFALIVPVVMLLLGGVVQFGVLYFAQHQLVEVGRDVGRWAATQQHDPCSDGIPALIAQADALATQARLVGYGAGDFTSAGVDATWTGETCPPHDSTDVAWVTIVLSHDAPTIVPGFPGMTLVTSAEFRMEPPPSP